MTREIMLKGTDFLDTIIIDGTTYNTVYDAIKADAITEDEFLEIVEDLEDEEIEEDEDFF